MLDPGMQAAPMPGGDPAALAAMLGGGDPMMGGAPPMDPAMMGGMPPEMMGAEPGMGMTPAGGNPYPTTDPNFMAQMLGQLLEAQEADKGQFAADQQAAMTGNPMTQALLGGAPMGPGAGQDGAGIAPGAELAPPPGV